MTIPDHIYWFKNIELFLKTIDEKTVDIIDFQYPSNPKKISNLISHIRNHYCKDEELDEMRESTGLSKKEYLKQVKIPDIGTVRSSDFSEILIADYIEFILEYFIPRTRYDNKINKNISPTGIDIIGFKVLDSNQINKNDKLITCEVKAALRVKNLDTLQNGIKDSIKDIHIRKAQSLNAIKQRCKDRRESGTVKIVERFQDITDRPYLEITGAAAVNSTEIWDDKIITEVSCEDHTNKNNLLLLVIRGKELMDFVNCLYERICDEA